ncbi:MAG: hypothetical protein QM783_11975 [Phycisphaerales bacterium]
MQTDRPVSPHTRRSTYVPSLALAAALAVLQAAGGCSAPPRTDPGAEGAAARALGLSVPIEFRTYGADGGPLDEPSAAPGGTLTLSEALRRAVTTDPALQAALARVRIAMADADQARLLPNPVLSVAVRFGDGKPQIEATLVQEFVQALQLPTRAALPTTASARPLPTPSPSLSTLPRKCRSATPQPKPPRPLRPC